MQLPRQNQAQGEKSSCLIDLESLGTGWVVGRTNQLLIADMPWASNPGHGDLLLEPEAGGYTRDPAVGAGIPPDRGLRGAGRQHQFYVYTYTHIHTHIHTHSHTHTHTHTLTHTHTHTLTHTHTHSFFLLQAFRGRGRINTSFPRAPLRNSEGPRLVHSPNPFPSPRPSRASWLIAVIPALRKLRQRGCIRTGEMAQRLRALTALPEVLSSIPSNHMLTQLTQNSNASFLRAFPLSHLVTHLTHYKNHQPLPSFPPCSPNPPPHPHPTPPSETGSSR